MDKQKGFTIIEIILVIAIIVALAAIIISNVTSSMNKSRDSAIKGNLSSLTTVGLQYFETNGNYNGFCTSTQAGLLKNAIESDRVAGAGAFNCYCNTGGNSCTNPSARWCACVQEKLDTSKVFCSDSSGAKKEVTSTCVAECPSSGVNAGICQ